MCRGLSESVLSANSTDQTLHDSFQSSRGEPLWPSGFVQFILCAVLSAALRESSVYSRTTHKILSILGKVYKKQLLIGGGNACSDWGILGYLCQAAVSIGHGWNSVRPIRYGSASCQRSLCTFLGCQRWVSDRFASCFCMHQPSRRCVTSDSWCACSPASRRGSPRCPRPRTVRKGLRRASTRR